MSLPSDLVADLHTWRQQHPHATFTDMEAEVAQRLAQMHAEAVGMLVSATVDAEAPPTCPACTQPMHASGTRTRHVQTRTGVVVRLTRAYFVCPACATGLFPPG